MADNVRFGRVSSIDYKSGTMEVTYDDREKSVTDKLCMIANRTYAMPKVGDGVVVLHNANGAEEGTVVGTIWSGENPPPEGKEGLFRRDLDTEPGQCYERYDAKKPEYLWHCEGDVKHETQKSRTETVEKEMTLTVKKKLTLKVGGTTVTISDDGSVTVQAGAVFSLSAQTVNISGETGDVNIGGVSLTGHTHTSSMSGKPTSSPIR